jgi:hypothetical protein
MSNETCYLLKQSDWLEYEDFSSSVVKIVLAAIVAIGITILILAIRMEISLKDYKPSEALGNMFKILYVLCGAMILVPIVILIFDASFTYSKASNVPYVTIALVALSTLSVLLLSLVVGIQVEVSKIGPLSSTPGALDATSTLFSNYIWIPTVLLILINMGLLFYKYKSSSGVNVAKRTIDWTNPRQVEPYLTEIATEQYAKCGLVLGEDVEAEIPILAFANYVEQNKQYLKFGKMKLPKDRMPNLPKMEAQLQADIEILKNNRRTVAEKIAAAARGRQLGKSTAERLATAKTAKAAAGDVNGDSILYQILSYPVKKFADFTGINNYRNANPFSSTSTDTVNIL